MLAINLLYLRKNLLRWYRAQARDLPWRRTKDPYKIWVSEIMLQQTQVDTVIPYYEKWVKKFPTVRLLAKAPLSEVLKIWAGLGYYRRAQMLHKAAKQIQQDFGGKLPETAEALQELPGIGRYTAGAIASIAFGKPAPILDGNVIRVLTRLYALKKNVQNIRTLKKLWGLAEEVLDHKNPGDFNQAMMELGAMVCSVENPKCPVCPLQKICMAAKQNRQTDYPVKLRKQIIEDKIMAALILRHDHLVWIQKQLLSDRWGHLWTFPHWENQTAMIKESGINTKRLKHKLAIRHSFTKYRILLEVFEVLPEIGDLPDGLRSRGQWVPIKNLGKYPFPSPHQKIADYLKQRMLNNSLAANRDLIYA